MQGRYPDTWIMDSSRAKSSGHHGGGEQADRRAEAAAPIRGRKPHQHVQRGHRAMVAPTCGVGARPGCRSGREPVGAPMVTPGPGVPPLPAARPPQPPAASPRRPLAPLTARRLARSLLMTRAHRQRATQFRAAGRRRRRTSPGGTGSPTAARSRPRRRTGRRRSRPRSPAARGSGCWWLRVQSRTP